MDEEPDLGIVTSDDPLSTPLEEESPIKHKGRKYKPKPKRHEDSMPLKAVSMKATVVDEMFPEGAGPYVDIDEAGGSSGLLMDLAANEKSVHTDFFNQFDDLYDDEDLS
ncbi:COP9 signalosome complex subunit 9 [Frankliniella fusca]|uniref:COP9 signalosome complex subunit 9 n=1 Tax=Frankliniella fusca TaxID=407009 RepID=A0AAE1I3B8_9NEOP|nr:COP9 signalosome complex subunit 9 [Frankliniella fusca]